MRNYEQELKANHLETRQQQLRRQAQLPNGVARGLREGWLTRLPNGRIIATKH